MKLAVDAAAARLGGGVSRIRELAGTLSILAPQHKYLFVTSASIAESLESVPPRSEFVRVPRHLQSVVMRLGWEHLVLPRKLRRAEVDWILAPFNVLPLGWPDPRVSRAVIVSNIAPFDPDLSKNVRGYQKARLSILRRLTVRSLHLADIVFYLSPHGQELVESVTRIGNSLLLPMSPPSPSLLRKAQEAHLSSMSNDAPFFVVIGDLMRHKAVHEAISATLTLERSGRLVRLLVCGGDVQKDYAAELRDLASQSERGMIGFLGTVPYDQLLRLMRDSVGTIVCSRLENTSRVPIEAMSVGSPLICVDVPWTRATCGEATLYYRPNDLDALTEVMGNVVENADVRSRLIDEGKRRLRGVDWLSATSLILESLGVTPSRSSPSLG